MSIIIYTSLIEEKNENKNKRSNISYKSFKYKIEKNDIIVINKDQINTYFKI